MVCQGSYWNNFHSWHYCTVVNVSSKTSIATIFPINSHYSHLEGPVVLWLGHTVPLQMSSLGVQEMVLLLHCFPTQETSFHVISSNPGCGITLASCPPRGQKTFPVSLCDRNRLCSSSLGPVAQSCTALKFCFLVCHGMISSIQTLRRFSTVSQAKAGSPGPLEINRPS